MAMITPYGPGSTDFACNGYFALTPDSCVVREDAGGRYELELSHPMDAGLRYQFFQVNGFIRADVPVRQTPRFLIDSPTKRYVHKIAVSVCEVHRSAGDTYVIKRLLLDEEVSYLADASATEARIVCPDGTLGVVLKTELSALVREEAGAPAETVQELLTRPQIFRIDSVEQDTDALSVKVTARHIYYDLLGNIAVSCNVDKKTVQQTLDLLSAAASQAHAFTFLTDTTDIYLTEDWSRKNIVDAHLDPETGVIAKAGGLELVRDNWTVYFLAEAGKTRGQPILHGSNLLGVTVTTDTKDIVNRIIPVGKDADGNPLLIDSIYVDAPDNDASTFLRASAIEYSVQVGQKDENDEDYTTNTAKVELERLANLEYSEKFVHVAQLTMDVDFLLLGDTEEFAQYRGLDRLYLYDTVQIIDSLHGVTCTAKVTGYEFDCLTGRYKSLRIGVTGGAETVGIISGYEIGAGTLTGSHIQLGSLGSGLLGSGVVNHLNIGVAQIGTAHIELAAITSALIANASITDAHIGTAGIDFGHIVDLIAEEQIFTLGIGDHLIVSRLQVTEANIAQLTLGTLILEGTDGNMYQIGVDEEGEVEATLHQIGATDITPSSITAECLDVAQIFAAEVMAGVINAVNIAAGSITTSNISATALSDIAYDAVGQHLLVQYSNGVILDGDNTFTNATARVYRDGRDVTDSIADKYFNWTRISDDLAGDAVWNAAAAHIGKKSVTLTSADVDFRCVIRCSVDERVDYLSASIVDGDLIVAAGSSEDEADWSISGGDLLYDGANDMAVALPWLSVDLRLASFTVDTTTSNLKTSYISIHRDGIEVYADGDIRIASGADVSVEAGATFNLRAGSGDDSIGISNNEANDYFLWAGDTTPSQAPFSVKMDGTIANVANSYAERFADNADATHPLVCDVWIPSDVNAVDKMLLTVRFEKFRAYSTGASSGGGSTSGNGGGETVTSASSTIDTGTWSGDVSLPSVDRTGTTISANQTTANDGPDHTHNIPTHYHSLSNHTHDMAAHKHSLNNHTHSVTVNAHSHSTPDHTHGITYGIYEGDTCTSADVYVDGLLRAVAQTETNLTNLDVSDWLATLGGVITRNAWHTISIKPNAMARLVANLYVKATVISNVAGTH